MQTNKMTAVRRALLWSAGLRPGILLFFAPLLLCSFALNASAAWMSFSFTNSDNTTPYTNYSKLYKVDDTDNGKSVIPQGLPMRITPAADGRFTNQLAFGNWFVTNNALHGAIKFRAPQDAGPTVYFFLDPGVIISGPGYNVTLVMPGGTNGPLTQNQITNALGYLPATPAQFYLLSTNDIDAGRITGVLIITNMTGDAWGLSNLNAANLVGASAFALTVSNNVVTSSNALGTATAAVQTYATGVSNNVVTEHTYAIGVSNVAAGGSSGFALAVSNNVVTSSNALGTATAAVQTYATGVSNNVVTEHTYAVGVSNVAAGGSSGFALAVSNNVVTTSNANAGASAAVQTYATGVSNNVVTEHTYAVGVSNVAAGGSSGFALAVSNNVVTTSNANAGASAAVQTYATGVSNNVVTEHTYAVGVSNNVVTTSNSNAGASAAVQTYATGVSNNVVTEHTYAVGVSNVAAGGSSGFALAVSNNVVTTSNSNAGASAAVQTYATGVSNNVVAEHTYAVGVSNNVVTTSNANTTASAAVQTYATGVSNNVVTEHTYAVGVLNNVVTTSNANAAASAATQATFNASLATFFVSSTNVLVSTNAGTATAKGIWAWNGAVYTNHETLAYRSFVGGQWSTYTNGIELYRGTNGAALGVTDTPIVGAGPGPGFYVGGYFSVNGYVNTAISTNGAVVFQNTAATFKQFASDNGLVYSDGAGILHAYNLVAAGTFSSANGQFLIDLFGNVTAPSFSGTGTNLTGLNPTNMVSGSLPATVTNTGPVLPAQIYGAVSNAVTATTASNVINLPASFGSTVTNGNLVIVGQTNLVISNLKATQINFSSAADNLTLDHVQVGSFPQIDCVTFNGSKYTVVNDSTFAGCWDVDAGLTGPSVWNNDTIILSDVSAPNYSAGMHAHMISATNSTLTLNGGSVDMTSGVSSNFFTANGANVVNALIEIPTGFSTNFVGRIYGTAFNHTQAAGSVPIQAIYNPDGATNIFGWYFDNGVLTFLNGTNVYKPYNPANQTFTGSGAGLTNVPPAAISGGWTGIVTNWQSTVFSNRLYYSGGVVTNVTYP
jgi:hypothetical protein